MKVRTLVITLLAHYIKRMRVSERSDKQDWEGGRGRCLQHHAHIEVHAWRHLYLYIHGKWKIAK